MKTDYHILVYKENYIHTWSIFLIFFLNKIIKIFVAFESNREQELMQSSKYNITRTTYYMTTGAETLHLRYTEFL